MNNFQKKLSFKKNDDIFEIENSKNSCNVNVTYPRIKKEINEIYRKEFIAVKLINKFSAFNIQYDNENSININLDNPSNEWYENNGPSKFIKLFNNYKFRKYFIGIFNYLCLERLNSNIKNKNLHFKVGDLVFKIDKISEKIYYFD